MATIQDVAKLAGVSVTTVSNVINNPNKVSEAKYTKVLNAIKELNYTPNIYATNLRTNKNNILCIIIPEMTPFFAQYTEELISSIPDSLCIVEITHYEPEVEAEIIKRVIAMGVSGLFLYSCEIERIKDLLYYLNQNHIPLLLIQNSIDDPNFTSICLDNEKLAYYAAKKAIAHYLMINENMSVDDFLIVTGSSTIFEADCAEGFKSAFNYSNKPKHISVRLTPELACLDFQKAVLEGKISPPPKYILISSEGIATGIKKAISYLYNELDIKIFTTSGDKWTIVDSQNTFYSSAKVLELAKKSAQIMSRYLKNPVFFEPTFIKIPIDKSKNEYRYTSTFPSTTRSNKTIRLLLYYRPWADSIKQLLPIFERQYNISIELVWVPTSIEDISIISHIPENHSSDIDIFVIPYYSMEQFASEDYLYPLSSLIADDSLSNYSESIRKLSYINDNKIYALPLSFNSQMLFYRKDIFERNDILHQFYREYGIELSPPKTWTDFTIISKFFTKSFNSSSPVKYGTILGMSRKSPLSDEFLPRQWAYHGRLFDEYTSKPNLTSQQNLKALTNIYDTYKYTPGSFYYNNDINDFELLQNNEIAMLNTFSTYIPSFQRGKSIEAGAIGCVNIPGGKPVIAGWLLGINRYSTSVQESFDFISWLTNKKNIEQNAFLGLFNPDDDLLNSVHCSRVFPWTTSFLNGVARAGTREKMCTKEGKIISPRIILGFLHNELTKSLLTNQSPDVALERINNILLDVYDGKISLPFSV